MVKEEKSPIDLPWKTGRARLLKLAGFLDKLVLKKPRQHFDMNIFGEHIARDGKPHTPKADLRFECGTTACALGWATVIQSFRRSGLHMEWEERDVWLDVSGRTIVEHSGTIVFGRHCDWDAGAYFFGIPYEASCDIFGSRRGTAKQVADRIRALVRKYDHDPSLRQKEDTSK